MKDNVTIHWFRQDLRLHDNPSLHAACLQGKVLPIFIHDDSNTGEHSLGGASQWWLHYSLKSLNKSLGGKLSIYQGNPEEIFADLTSRLNVKAIHWNRCYEPWRVQRDEKIKAQLKSLSLNVESFNGSLLWEPWEIAKANGEPYKVFTPFYRKGCLQAAPPRPPLPEPKSPRFFKDTKGSLNLKDLALLPKIRWDKQLESHWQIGEEGAYNRLKSFIDEGLPDYKEGRNNPSKPFISRLSPHIHFGEISPNQIWHAVRNVSDDQNMDHFCSELGWREFCHSQLFYNPTMPNENLKTQFNHFPWAKDAAALRAWQQGQTGIPIVDAGMRELWQTGFMHNRVRMVAASFLVKNLRLDWRLGERWFWDTLVDADLANNSAGWQWVAGCGADAAPYFRIFNPVTQGQKFDAEGEYTRKYVPELAALPNKYLFNPWEAPHEVLEKAKVNLGETYPNPIVDLKESREAALNAFKSLPKQ